MMRTKPRQHRRRLSSGKVITVNKGVVKRKVYKVNARRRSKTISYRPTGFVRTAYDEKGHFQGSKVIKTPKALDSKNKTPEVYEEEVKRLDNDLATGKISIDKYNDDLTSLLIP